MSQLDAVAMAAALEAAYAGITTVVADLDDNGLLTPTGCHGWLVVDLLVHVTGDAQRALVALATPADGPADVDFVSYWKAFPGVGDHTAAAAHAQWIRRTAAAFQAPTDAVRLWRDTAPAAARAATTAVRARAAAASPLRPVEVSIFDPLPSAGSGPPAVPYVATQGHVIALPDFLATLVTEAVVHHLDLIRQLPEAPPPCPEAVSVALSTLQGLSPGGALAPQWTPHEALLKATGRAPLDDTARRWLGDAAADYPLLG
jgi:hypothetical protein